MMLKCTPDHWGWVHVYAKRTAVYNIPYSLDYSYSFLCFQPFHDTTIVFTLFIYFSWFILYSLSYAVHDVYSSLLYKTVLVTEICLDMPVRTL